ncbi:DUF6515 family protein [Aquiflexum sp.]|uniref:DUF6515 family protein n=1 Tax=Aquiflexum sp. TaxID=1872584 RepID=UPI003593C7F9
MYTLEIVFQGFLYKFKNDFYPNLIITRSKIEFYRGGVFFEKTANGFVVVPPTADTLVENLSDGGEEIKIGDRTLIRFGETYYQPVQVNGRNMYGVVYIEEEE